MIKFTHPITLERQATVALVLLSVCVVLFGQSGRRAAKTPPPTAPSPAPGDGKDKPAIDKTAVVKTKLLVALEHTKKRLPTEDAIFTNFVRRLNEFADVSTMAIGELKQDQAVKRAQQETESYVVLLQFEIETFQNGRVVLNSQNLQVNCYAYAPATGERTVKEKTYYQAIGGMGTRTTGSPGGTPVKITTEAAGVSAAEQLHNGIRLIPSKQFPPKP